MTISKMGLAYTFFSGERERPPIVILHGLLGSHKNFASFAKKFSELGFPVLCIDLRNHGVSFHDEQFDYPAMAADLEALLSELDSRDWSRVVVLGHSLGGRVAMMYALLYPRRVAALIIVDVVPSRKNPDIGIGKIVEAMAATQLALAASSRKQVEDTLRSELRARGSESEAVLQFLLLCNLRQDYQWSSNIEAILANLANVTIWPELWLRENFHKYVDRPYNADVPLLLIVGEHSPYVDEEGWELLLQYFPHSEKAPTVQQCIAETHHWPHTEAPEEFQRRVLDFLQLHS